MLVRELTESSTELWLRSADDVLYSAGCLLDCHVPVRHHDRAVLPGHYTTRCSYWTQVLPQSRLLTTHQHPGLLSTTLRADVDVTMMSIVVM